MNWKGDFRQCFPSSVGLSGCSWSAHKRSEKGIVAPPHITSPSNDTSYKCPFFMAEQSFGPQASVPMSYPSQVCFASGSAVSAVHAHGGANGTPPTSIFEPVGVETSVLIDTRDG